MDNYPEISNIRKSIKSHYPVSDESIGLLCLYHYRAGFEYVETIEPTLAYSIPISILNELYETNIEIANWGRVMPAVAAMHTDRQSDNDRKRKI